MLVVSDLAQMCAGTVRPKNEASRKEAQGWGAVVSSALGLAAVTLQSWALGSVSPATVLVCLSSCLALLYAARAIILHHQHYSSYSSCAVVCRRPLRGRGCAIIAAEA